ncbi:MAG: methyl-accepting chemotaxis protein [Nitrospirota bacterium]
MDKMDEAGTLNRQFYIKTDYQKGILLKLCLLASGGLAALCAVFTATLDKDLRKGYVQALDGMRSAYAQAAGHYVVAGTATIALLGLAVWCIVLLMSHRIAGPLWRFEKTAEAVGQGDLRPVIQLRKMDELQKLSDSMNRTVADLRERVKSIREDHERLESELASLTESYNPETPVAARAAAIQRALERSTELVNGLGRFKTY